MDKKTLLVISQVYVPDPAAVGQYMADAAAEMVTRGWRVVVLTSARGYHDPKAVYKRREVIDGVEVVRLPLSSFGKRSILVRLLAQTIFLAQAIVRGLLMRDVSAVLVSTSPPHAAAAGCIVSALRRVPMTFWIMDLNPDQMIMMGRISDRSLPARAFDALNRVALRRARKVIVLDRFMAERVRRKADVSSKLQILPLWPNSDRLRLIPESENAFRREHRLNGKFVVMYSGNHSPANPISTMLAAAGALRADPRFMFLFVGGGQTKTEVERAISVGATNILSLPYQPLSRLSESLSAADVHVASIGPPLVGVVHPCKIYNALALGRPVLTFGPRDCHLADLVTKHQLGFHVEHGDTGGTVRALELLADMTKADLRALGVRASGALRSPGLNRVALLDAFCREVDGQLVPADTGSTTSSSSAA